MGASASPPPPPPAAKPAPLLKLLWRGFIVLVAVVLGGYGLLVALGIFLKARW